MKWLLIIWLWAFANICHAQSITGAGDPWPPFISPGEAGQPAQGVALEIVTEAFKREGYELTMNFVPWARAIGGVKKGDYDILVGTWWTQERTEFLHYSDFYLENSIKFIKRVNDDFQFNDMASLDGKKIGIVRDYGYGDKFLKAKNFTKSETNDFIINLKKLIDKRVDLTLEDEIVARAWIAENDPELLNKIEFTENALSKNKLYVTSGIKNTQNKAIIDAFNLGLKAIKSDGTFDKILEKHKLK